MRADEFDVVKSLQHKVRGSRRSIRKSINVDFIWEFSPPTPFFSRHTDGKLCLLKLPIFLIFFNRKKVCQFFTTNKICQMIAANGTECFHCHDPRPASLGTKDLSLCKQNVSLDNGTWISKNPRESERAGQKRNLCGTNSVATNMSAGWLQWTSHVTSRGPGRSTRSWMLDSVGRT